MVELPTRLVVSDLFRDAHGGLGTGVSGKIESGYIAKGILRCVSRFLILGDKLLVLPLNEVCQVKLIKAHDDVLDVAGSGRNVSVSLAGVDLSQISYDHFYFIFANRNIFLDLLGTVPLSLYSRFRYGSVLCDPQHPVPLVTRFRAKVLSS